jgi:hypothetical protein
MKLAIERCTASGATREEAHEVSREAVINNLSRFRDDWSTTIWIERSEEDLLALTLSSGRLAVFTAQQGEFYDLVGDREATARVEFVHGGQAATHPARHIVPLTLAIRAAETYIDSPSMLLGAFTWERQGAVEV